MLSYMWKWLKLFFLDVTKKEFIAIKVLSVLILGGLTSLFPFLTIHARSLGITEDELGIILSIMPVIGIFVPAMAGMLADKMGNFKIFLCCVLLAGSFTGLSLLAIPQARHDVILPGELPVNLTCSSNNGQIDFHSKVSCPTKNITENIISVHKCSYVCSQSIPSSLQSSEWCSVTEGCTPTFGISTENASALEISFYLARNETEDLEFTVKDCFSNEEMEDSCELHCHASIPRDEICVNNSTTVNYNPALTFVIYTTVRLLLKIFTASSMTQFEGSIVAMVKEYKGNIGFQRVYLNIGMIVMTPISGYLIDVFSIKGETANYGPAVYLYFGFNTLCAFLFLFVNLEFKKPAKQVVKNLGTLLKDFEVDCLLFVSFMAGAGFGFLETFLFWLLEDLGGDKTMMGMTITVGAASGIPIMIISSSIIKRFGHPNVITFSLAVFVIRFLGYSIISNPWNAMIFEAMECFTLALLGVTVVSYIEKLSTSYTVVTLQGLVGSIGGIGHGSGNLLGGFLVKAYGIQKAFQLMSVVYASGTFLYFISNLLVQTWKRKSEKSKDIELKTPQNILP